MVALALILALTGFEFALAVPGNGRCAPLRDFSVNAGATAFGSAGAAITGMPAADTGTHGVQGGEFINQTAFNLAVSVSTSTTNCSGGRANFIVLPGEKAFISPGDQKFGSTICVIRQDAGALSAGTFTACLR